MSAVDPRAAITRLRVINLRELRTHRLRLVTSLAVIAVSSLLLVAVLSAYGSITSSVQALSTTISGSADLEVTGVSETGVDETLVGQLRANVAQAGAVVPLIQTTTRVAGRQALLLGSDLSITGLGGAVQSVLTEAQTTTENSGRTLDPATSVVVGPGLGLREGQRTEVGGQSVTVAAVVDLPQVRPIADGRFVVAFLPLAQRISDMPGHVSSILIRAGADTAQADQLRAAVDGVVAGRASVNDPDFRTQLVEDASAVTRDSTLLVAMISLVIAAFLVFNMMTMAVASRRGTLAMIRAIGGRRGPLIRDLLGEAAVIGLVGGGIGVPLGMLCGRWIIGRLPTTASSQIGATLAYSMPGYVAPVAIGACVVACVAASALAARGVLAVSPVEALGQGEQTGPDRIAPWLLVVSGVLGASAIAGGWVVAYTVTGSLVFGSAVLCTIGSLLLCFAFTGPLVRASSLVAQRFRASGQLASITAERSPRRVWATVMTVAVAIAVGVGTSGAMDDLIGSVSGALDGIGDPDLYVATRPVEDIPTGPDLDPSVQRAVADVPGVDSVVGGQWATLTVGPAQFVVQGLTDGTQSPFVKRISARTLDRVVAGDGLVLSTTMAHNLRVTAGDTVRLPSPTGFHTLRVLQVVEYAAIQSGTGAMSNTLLQRWFDRPGDTYLQVTIAPGADPASVRSAVSTAARAASGPDVDRPGGRVEVYTGAETVVATRAEIEQSGAFTIAIQWVVALVGAVALLNTLLLSVIERRRELGVFRAMGASRRFVSAMVLAEAAAVATVGAALGIGLGQLVHGIGNRVLSVNLAIDIGYHLEPIVAVYVVVAFALCVAGSLIPARRAARMTIVDAIAQE